MTKEKFWGKFYKWDELLGDPIPGYTLLLPVPGDLPVFLKIALEVCSLQASDHLVETLAIPDHLTSGLPDLFKAWAENYHVSPVRLVNLKPLDQLLAQKLNHPHMNYWFQLIRGGMATRTTHALMHDADLFITDPAFLKTHYETCVGRHLACLGVSPIWDSWYQEQGVDHVVATREMIFEAIWLRSFQPWQHQAHENVLDGKRYMFDTTLWPQCKTPPERVGLHPQERGFIHFNYVIGTYRWFQQSQGPYEDKRFRLLLIRLLIDAYDPYGWPYEVPPLNDLIKGLADSSNRVTYLQESTRQHYPVFRSKLQQLIDSGLLSKEKTSILQDGIGPFDQAFG